MTLLGDELTSNCTPGVPVSYDTDCSFSCTPGYELVGAPSVHCTEQGNFSASFPQCFGKNIYTNRKKETIVDCIPEQYIPAV